jgi:hypothetical protein
MHTGACSGVAGLPAAADINNTVLENSVRDLATLNGRRIRSSGVDQNVPPTRERSNPVGNTPVFHACSGSSTTDGRLRFSAAAQSDLHRKNVFGELDTLYPWLLPELLVRSVAVKRRGRDASEFFLRTFFLFSREPICFFSPSVLFFFFQQLKMLLLLLLLLLFNGLAGSADDSVREREFGTGSTLAEFFF